jgi:chaperonin cofactor prefoldin
MELEKFEQAKKVKENLDRLERQKYKLESALKSCSLNVTVGFTHTGAFQRKDEVSFFHKDFIKEMISKELDRLNEQMVTVKEEFEKV